MKKKESDPLREEIRVLAMGNNPTDLGHVFDSLAKIQGKKIITEIAFDLQSLIDRLTRFHPDFVLIDDNIGNEELKNSIEELHKHRKTRDIPITVLKNSNYREAFSLGVLNYVLKAQITGESLYNAFRNSLKFIRTQAYLLRAYRSRKHSLRSTG